MISCSSVFHAQVSVIYRYIIYIYIFFLSGGGGGWRFLFRCRPNATNVGGALHGHKIVTTEMHNQVMFSCL